MNRKINRRSLIKGLTALPLISVLGPLEQAISQTKRPAKIQIIPRKPAETATLNVWFHGLFGLVVMEDHILGITPRVPDHQYFVGSLDNKQCLTEGEWYRLLGADDTGNPSPASALERSRDNPGRPVIFGINDINLAKSEFLLRIPFPEKITIASYRGGIFKVAGKTQSTSYPEIQVFSYKVPDVSKLRLDGFTQWEPQVEKGCTQTINLHFFAGPTASMSESHVQMAFSKLKELFPGTDIAFEDLDAGNDDVKPASDLAGVDPCGRAYHLTLAEWLAQHKGFHPFGGGANCFQQITVIPSKLPSIAQNCAQASW